MSKKQPTLQVGLPQLGQALQTLGRSGTIHMPLPAGYDLLVESQLAMPSDVSTHKGKESLIATNRLFSLGPTRTSSSALRRVLSLLPDYRSHLLRLLFDGIRCLADDSSLAETLAQLDHLSPELLQLARGPSPAVLAQKAREEFDSWNMVIWRAPDAVTLLAKVAETPADFAALPIGTVIAVGFDWLNWETPPANAAPAPWADPEPLTSTFSTVHHPFWGAMVATLDACTGDYEWQSLILRGGLLRSRHRTLGKAEPVIAELWKRELGLYPAAPLIVPEGMEFVPGKPLPWLQPALDRLADTEVAIESEGSWRLTDRFRTQLMKDDEHMMAFEAVRQRSYRLARAAAMITEQSEEVVAS